MKYKLIDVENHIEEDVLFGTCDLCEYLGTHNYDILVFENLHGVRYSVENGAWDWGTYMSHWHIDNYVDFAAFIKDRQYPDPKNDYYGNPQFELIVDMMVDDYEESKYDPQ